MIPSIEVENTQGTGSLLLSRGEEGITVTMTFVDFDSSLTAYDALAIETPMGTFPAEDLRDAVRILAGELETSERAARAVVRCVYGPDEPEDWQMDNARDALRAAAREPR